MIFFLAFSFSSFASFPLYSFSNCSSRFLGKLDGVEHNIVMSFINISGQKKEIISVFYILKDL